MIFIKTATVSKSTLCAPFISFTTVTTQSFNSYLRIMNTNCW